MNTSAASGDENVARTVSLRRVAAAAGRDGWRALPDLLLLHVLFTAAGAVFLGPLAAWLFQQLVAASGKAAIGNFDIVRCLLTPFGLTAAFGLVVLAAAAQCAELAGLVAIGYGAAENRRVTYYDALRLVGSRAPRLVWVCARVLAMLAATLLPFLAAALLTAWLLLTGHDINYYLDARPPEFWAAVAVGAALAMAGGAAAALVGVPLLFVLPEILLRDGSGREAFLQSRRLARGAFFRIAGAIVGWLALWSLASFAVNTALYFLGQELILAAAGRVTPLVLALGCLVTLSAATNAALHVAAVTAGACLIVHLHREACRQQDAPLPLAFGESAVLGKRPQWSLPKKSPLLAAAGLAVAAAVVAAGLLESLGWEDHVEISAHRGASLAAPENTLPAFERAIANGATFLELDVQRTADGVLVVAHDADLMRMAGVPLVIRHATFAELRSADVGSHFGPEFAGQNIPTLDEVLDIAADRARLLIELKSYSPQPDALLADVVQTLRARGLLERAVVMSLNYPEVQAIQRLEPRLAAGFVATASLGDISRLDADFLAVPLSQATDALIGAAHAQGKEVYVWTVDDPRQMSRALDRGVDNIITNDPAALVRVLQERSTLSNAERLLLRYQSLYLD
jgi:glycerophosphoryl diester phosphodiesterase